ncbi:MAG: anthranilate phosphoribosyltransferase [Calditerrivibrio sp.]|nr:anthranilate phosphoribosyltransferase [Calditerrivibrio sp.]
MELVKKVNNGAILTFEESKQLFELMVTNQLSEAQIASILISMKHRKESAEEIAAAAKVLMDKMIPFEHDLPDAIDTCGTGGDGKSTVNISTAVAINLASMGEPVIKHGNIAQSGKIGSADILELLHIPCRLEKKEAEDFFKKHRFVFLFAPFFHPILKNVAKIRKEIMTSTIFNFLGPLLNPGNPAYQIIGISKREMLKTYADAALMLNKGDMVIYSSDDGFDEVSTSEITKAYIIEDGKIDYFFIDPSEFFKPFPLPVVENGEEALKLFIEGIKGENEDIVKIFALNTAVALYIKYKWELKESYKRAYDNIKSGNAFKKISQLRGENE